MSVPRFPRLRAPFAAVLALASVALSACDDDPFGFNDWVLTPDTAFLYSLDRPELNLPSGFNMSSRVRVEVEAAGSTGNWDFLVNTIDGRMVLMTPTAVGLETRAAIAPVPDQTFEGIRSAPADTTAYISREPVPMEVGRLYVVRTNLRSDSFGQSCSFYGKLEPLEIDVAGGTFLFRYDTSPLCNSRDLVPPED